ncbi:MAG TPA: antibiotic biosynthesis monooxygenase family protein [Desulfobacterales bacterium]
MVSEDSIDSILWMDHNPESGKEETMAIKVLIKRKFKSGKRKEISQLLNRARYSAMGMKGYLSSETLTDLNDPDRIAVSSMWRTLDDWKNWKNEASRAEVVGEMEKIMVEPEAFELYEMGMQTDI